MIEKEKGQTMKVEEFTAPRHSPDNTNTNTQTKGQMKIRLHRDGYKRYWTEVNGRRYIIEAATNPHCLPCFRWVARAAGIYITGFTLRHVRQQLEKRLMQ